MAATYTPIATTTLGSAASSYTFSSIPSTYTDLVLVANTNQSSTSNMSTRFNSDSGTNYSFTYVGGGGSSAFSGRGTSVAQIDSNYQTGGSWGQTNMSIQNYANTTTYKTMISRASDATQNAIAYVGLWRSTSAINSITLSVSAGTFAIGSTFTLYGIKAA